MAARCNSDDVKVLSRTTSMDSSELKGKQRVAPSSNLSSRPLHALCRSKNRSYTSPHLLIKSSDAQPSDIKENEPVNAVSSAPASIELHKMLAKKAHSFGDSAPPPPSLACSAATAVDIFLGGSCNPTTWRRDIAIPMLQDANVCFYNPQVDEWFEELIQIETRAKETAKIVLMVIDNLTRSIVCINEAVEYICRGRRVVLVVQDIVRGTKVDGNELREAEIADLNGARECLRALALKKETRLYDNVQLAVHSAIEWLQEDNLTVLAPAVPRLRKRSSIILNEWSGQVRPRRSTSRSCSSTSLLSILPSKGTNDTVGDTVEETDSHAFVKHLGCGTHAPHPGSVYLGGNLQATSWREHVAIPSLQQAGIPFYIPFQDYLSFELQRLSGAPLSASHTEQWKEMENEKAHAELILFVIPGNARSIAAMTEAVELVCSRYAMLLVIEPVEEGCQVEDGSRIYDREYKDLARARAYLQEMAERNDIEVFASVRDAVHSIVERLE